MPCCFLVFLNVLHMFWIYQVEEEGMMPRSSAGFLTATKSDMGKKKGWRRVHLNLLFGCVIMMPLLICGCSHFNEDFEAKSNFSEANDFYSQGNYTASLGTYQQIIEKYPTTGDRVLFEMGIIYAYPGNEHKDYQKSLDCFQKLIKDYPRSEYRKDSELMVFNINNVLFKDKTIATQREHIGTLQQEIQNKGSEITALHNKIEVLEQELRNRESENVTLQKELLAFPKGPADKILIEKNERRLTLLLKGKVLRTYKIALGGNPYGPKEKQGDNKTPEGTYVIDSRNRGSLYHLSLHVSYPNDKDRKRAKQLGVSPGGDIMIHGIKNGFAWVGDLHTKVDWTKGCIAVTDEEIEEIDTLAPNGTIVEIRP